jgi:hypothetical protein
VANARTWLACNLAAWRSRHRPGYLLVRYETLVNQPELELMRICAHLDEDYDPSMLRPDSHAVTRPRSRLAYLAVTAERLDKWREELTGEQAALVEWVVGRHMDTFEYQRAAGRPSRLEIARGLGWAAFDALRRRVVQFPGAWYYVMQPTRLTKEEFSKHRREWERISPDTR